MKMMEMRLGAIGIDKDSGQSVVLLHDTENRRALPIWIGLAEVRAITHAVRNVVTARPSTHELLYTTIKQLGYEIQAVSISEMKGDVFLADIVLQKIGQEITTTTLDARPSDAIALAAFCDAPLYVASDILQKAGISANPERDHKETMDFRNFVEHLKASDFNLAGKTESLDSKSEALDIEKSAESESEEQG
jgi:uncharacterized protein